MIEGDGVELAVQRGAVSVNSRSDRRVGGEAQSHKRRERWGGFCSENEFCNDGFCSDVGGVLQRCWRSFFFFKKYVLPIWVDMDDGG